MNLIHGISNHKCRVSITYLFVLDIIRYYEILLDVSIYVMGLVHMFLFLYKHNPMCSIYTKDLSYSSFLLF